MIKMRDLKEGMLVSWQGQPGLVVAWNNTAVFVRYWVAGDLLFQPGAGAATAREELEIGGVVCGGDDEQQLKLLTQLLGACRHRIETAAAKAALEQRQDKAKAAAGGGAAAPSAGDELGT